MLSAAATSFPRIIRSRPEIPPSLTCSQISRRSSLARLRKPCSFASSSMVTFAEGSIADLRFVVLLLRSLITVASVRLRASRRAPLRRRIGIRRLMTTSRARYGFAGSKSTYSRCPGEASELIRSRAAFSAAWFPDFRAASSTVRVCSECIATAQRSPGQVYGRRPRGTLSEESRIGGRLLGRAIDSVTVSGPLCASEPSASGRGEFNHVRWTGRRDGGRCDGQTIGA